MTDLYMKEVLRVAVAQICQTIGYNATQSAPLELLQDVLDKFMREFTRDLRRHVEHYNRNEPNMDDMALTMDSINVNLNELLDYVNNVEPVPFVVDVPKFPARKDSYLNFLKPGSKEVLTRPVHVHDHLPPMLPPDINQQALDTNVASTSNGNFMDIKPASENLHGANNLLAEGRDPQSGQSTALDQTTLQSLFKPASNLEDGDRPAREVSSVVMTTGGFISPAVEGKMPEAIIPDIIDKLLGLDAPPPPPPPRPPTPVPPPPVSRPPSRSLNTSPVPTVDSSSTPAAEDNSKEKTLPSEKKESKKSLLNKALDITAPAKKSDTQHSNKKEKKLFKSLAAGGNTPSLTTSTKASKKSSMLMQHNMGAGPNFANQSTSYANMLLKKAKKQKNPHVSQQQFIDKQNFGEKSSKLDPAEKTQRKYVKMLQKMAKQGKIPPELLSTIMGPDKKSKMFNPAVLSTMPPGPDKMQLEKLLKKQAKQRQKLIKQQMMQEQQKLKKAQQHHQYQHPPPLVPLFTPTSVRDKVNKPLTIDMEDTKLEPQDLCKTSPIKSGVNTNHKTPAGQIILTESHLHKNLKTPVASDTQIGPTDMAMPHLQNLDGKEHKLSTEPDRSKLNIFKKISKQKTPKSSSPTPLRLAGLVDTPIINLPSGTTITPAPGPGSATSVNRSLFPPPPESTGSKVIDLDDLKEKPLGLDQPSSDALALNRVFGEKTPGGDAEFDKKPKKRGRKPGSKNAPKIPGISPAGNTNSMKKNKKMKMDGGNLFMPPQLPQIPPDFVAAAASGNLTFDDVAHLFANPINPMDFAQSKQLQQQMLIMAAAKERKEQKKKNKVSKHDAKQDLQKTDSNSLGSITNLALGRGVGPTNEEVQNINKKLMRMDTILKPAPSLQANDLSVDTSLITGKKMPPSPSLFTPPSNASTSPMKSPLKSPGSATKRMIQHGVDAIAAAAAAGLAQPFMLGNRPAFPNLPTNMLSMLPFAFPPRPGLIPAPGLFPTPGLAGFPNNPKNLLPGMFPFPNLKQNLSTSDMAKNQETEDLSMNKKKPETSERSSYCNVAPLVPEFLKLNNPNNMKQTSTDFHNKDTDLPKTPKARNPSSSSTQDNFHKKMTMIDVHTPESITSDGTKSLPSTPGGLSFNAFEQLLKKSDSPLELVTTKCSTPSQDSGLDFTVHKKHTPPGMGVKQPITLNNEPIEVSDDSDETSQPPAKHHQSSSVQAQTPNAVGYNIDDLFVANTGVSKTPVSLECDLSSKELKKLKKQVKKTTASINSSLLKAEKSDGVSKLAGGADLIPLASTGLAYSSKNIPFNSLTANSNPSFNNPHKPDFNPPTSNVFDNLTITSAIPSNTPSSNIFDVQKKRSKEHKKMKKIKELKEGKIKKKKDKKDKTKSKEKSEKYLHSQQRDLLSTNEQEKEPAELSARNTIDNSTNSASLAPEKVKDKDTIKKLKKEKKKEKQRLILDDAPVHQTASHSKEVCKESSLNVPEVAEKKQKSSPSAHSTSSGTEAEAAATTQTSAVVPKLTLKLGSTQSPTPIDDFHKNAASSKETVGTTIVHSGKTSPKRDNQREQSPELARISPLVTRPPKHKSNSNDLASSSSTATNASSTTNSENFGESNKPGSSSSNANVIVPPPSPWLSGGTISASSVLLPHQLLQTTKQHDMTTAPSSNQSTDSSTKTHSADRQSPLTLITETSRPSSYIDAEGNRVWICPACGKVDDGSPMIGCDGCDAWYHWVCVGIFVAPKDNEDWFCRVCITRKKGLHGSDKKRKRNKKK